MEPISRYYMYFFRLAILPRIPWLLCLKMTFLFELTGVVSVLDPPEHLFRIRLICTLLDTCGQYFDHGNYKKKLDCFLVYFQVSDNCVEFYQSKVCWH